MGGSFCCGCLGFFLKNLKQSQNQGIIWAENFLELTSFMWEERLQRSHIFVEESRKMKIAPEERHLGKREYFNVFYLADCPVCC